MEVALLAEFGDAGPLVRPDRVGVAACEGASVARIEPPTEKNVRIVVVSEAGVGPRGRRFGLFRDHDVLVLGEEALVEDPGRVVGVALEAVEGRLDLDGADVAEVEDLLGQSG